MRIRKEKQNLGGVVDKDQVLTMYVGALVSFISKKNQPKFLIDYLKGF